MKTKLWIETESEKAINNFMKLPIEKQRFLFYSDKICTIFTTMFKYEDDEKICYFLEDNRLKFGKKPYIKRDSSAGYTYNKATKKVKKWFGQSLMKQGLSVIHTMFQTEKKEWFNVMPEELQYRTTPTLLGLVMSGKITNPIDYCKRYLSTSVRVKVSPKLYYKKLVDIKESKKQAYSYSVDIHTLNQMMMYAVNPEHALTCTFKEDYTIKDILKECKILNKKVDWSWSDARIKQEHTDMSRLVMDMELETLEDKTVDYKGELVLPETWKLINTKKTLYVQGRVQDHCVYSYWSTVESKHCFILAITHNDKLYTADIRKKVAWNVDDEINKDKFYVSQFHGIRNSFPSTEIQEELTARLDEVMNISENIEFFNKNYSDGVKTIHRIEENAVLL